MLTTEQIIQSAVDKFNVERPTKFLSLPGIRGRIHKEGEKILELPNGVRVKVHVDASGTVTHIHEDHVLHAIARPNTIQRGFR